jgi:hypothetical protein
MGTGRHCAACARALEPGALYYRFALALEGEQDVVDTTGGDAEAELEEAVEALERGPDDPAHWEEQVHWERSGVLCPECRERLVRLVGGERPFVH